MAKKFSFKTSVLPEKVRRGPAASGTAAKKIDALDQLYAEVLRASKLGRWVDLDTKTLEDGSCQIVVFGDLFSYKSKTSGRSGVEIARSCMYRACSDRLAEDGRDSAEIVRTRLDDGVIHVRVVARKKS